MPQDTLVPIPLLVFLRLLPLDAQETSYFAASANILSFSVTLSFIICSLSIVVVINSSCFNFYFDNLIIIIVDNKIIISLVLAMEFFIFVEKNEKFA